MRSKSAKMATDDTSSSFKATKGLKLEVAANPGPPVSPWSEGIMRVSVEYMGCI